MHGVVEIVPQPVRTCTNAPAGLVAWWRAEANTDDSAGTNDHPHHKSAWFCHGDIIPVGMKVTKRGGEVEGVVDASFARAAVAKAS